MYKRQRVRHVITGGSALGPRAAAFWAGAGIDVLETYGLTEAVAAGVLGRPLPGGAVRIADDGEVLLRGGHVFAGYWDAAAGGAVRREEWFATGDLGALDAEGRLGLAGRKRTLIAGSGGGPAVAPEPLEERVRAHPLVGQCVVIGAGRPHLVALITLDEVGLARWQRMHDMEDVPVEELVHDAGLLAELRGVVDEAGASGVLIRRFGVLPGQFTVAGGHLTPTLRPRRDAIVRDFAAEIAELYEG